MKSSRNRYLSDDHDDFIVTGRESIINLLRSLALGNITLGGTFNAGREVLLSEVLGVDPAEDAVYLDINANEDRNRQFLLSPRIIFIAYADGAKIQWTSLAIGEATFEGSRAFRIAIPETLQRIQRRSAFRVATPIAQPVICRIPVAPDREIALPLVDICVEGIGVILPDPPETAIQKNAQFKSCRLDHEDIGIADLTLSVQSMWEVTLKNGHISQRAGLEFVDINKRDEPAIQRFVFMLERRRIATLKDH